MTEAVNWLFEFAKSDGFAFFLFIAFPLAVLCWIAGLFVHHMKLIKTEHAIIDKVDKKLNDQPMGEQAWRLKAVHNWMKYIRVLVGHYEDKSKIIKALSFVKIFYNWCIGYFVVPGSGRFLLLILPATVAIFIFLADAKDRKLDRAYGVVARAEDSLKNNKNNNERLSFSSFPLGLKDSLELLNQNEHNLNYLYLPHSKLSGIKLFKAELDGGFFNKANLDKANLSQTYLRKVNLNDANLNGADLSWADLGSAELNEANLNQANLSKANLEMTGLNYANLSEANLSKAILFGTKLSDAYLKKANISKASLYKAEFKKANLKEANFSASDLFGSGFRGADMDRANLKGAVITGVDFTDAKNLTKEQIMETCWLRAGTYIVDGKEIMIKATLPILPKYIDINVHSLPSAKLGDKIGDIAYCP